MATRYVPPHPPRSSGPVPAWRGLFGERARTAVYGWSDRAFEQPYLGRTVLGIRVHIPLDPDAVQHVLLENQANYSKPDLVKKLLRPTIGEGLVSSDGELWREQRRIVAASFVPTAVDALVPCFARAAEEAMAGWKAGETIDVATEATATTMRVIADALFAGDDRLTSRRAMAHIRAALASVSESRLQLLLRLPLMPWSRRGLAGHRGQRFLRRILAEVVAERMATGRADDFLGHLIAALGERFEPDRAASLAVDNAATFYLAGHETTANALTWTLFLLAEQPDLQASLAEEASAALAVGANDAGLPTRLPRLRAVIDESLRLYPPAPRFDRQAIAPDRIGDVEVRAGDIVSIWPWLIHRHRRLWDDPDAFDPGRFAPGKERHRFQYLPFGGGPRVCVGARFAITEALTILAHWLARFAFARRGQDEVRLSGLVTLRPLGGMPLELRRRG